jgi:hypothetical protein
MGDNIAPLKKFPNGWYDGETPAMMRRDSGIEMEMDFQPRPQKVKTE